MALLDIGLTLLGGLLGGKKNESSTTQQNAVDPRFAEYMYGQDGVMPAARDWYKENRSGMNDQMVQGMNNQWNQHEASRPGFNQMQGLGMSLMGGGVAGNPFRNGGNLYGSAGNSGAVNAGGPAYQPAPVAGGGGPFVRPPAYQPPPIQIQAPDNRAPGGGGQQEPPHGNERDFSGGSTGGSSGGWSPNELTGGLLGGGAMGYSQGVNGFMNGPYGQMIGQLGNAILGQQDPTNVPVRDAAPRSIADILAEAGIGGRGSEGGGWGGHGGNADGYGGGGAGFGNGRAW